MPAVFHSGRYNTTHLFISQGHNGKTFIADQTINTIGTIYHLIKAAQNGFQILLHTVWSARVWNIAGLNKNSRHNLGRTIVNEIVNQDCTLHK